MFLYSDSSDDSSENCGTNAFSLVSNAQIRIASKSNQFAG